MPNPVDALPWASRSISSTCSPTAASAVARLIAVVVLPTPPFWLAIAKSCGAIGTDSEDDGVKVGHAVEGLMGNVPVLHGLGHLSLPALTLVEKANSGIGSVPIGPTEQLAERRQGPGGDHIGWGRGHGFNAADYDFWLLFQRHAAGGLAQEGRFPGVRLDQRDVEVRAQRRHDQPGKTSATAQIRQGFRPVRDQPLELGGIQDMA